MTEEYATKRQEELKYLIGKRYYHRKSPLKGIVEDVYVSKESLDKYVVKIDIRLERNPKKPNAPRIHTEESGLFIIFWDEKKFF